MVLERRLNFKDSRGCLSPAGVARSLGESETSGQERGEFGPKGRGPRSGPVKPDGLLTPRRVDFGVNGTWRHIRVLVNRGLAGPSVKSCMIDDSLASVGVHRVAKAALRSKRSSCHPNVYPCVPQDPQVPTPLPALSVLGEAKPFGRTSAKPSTCADVVAPCRLRSCLFCRSRKIKCKPEVGSAACAACIGAKVDCVFVQRQKPG